MKEEASEVWSCQTTVLAVKIEPPLKIRNMFLDGPRRHSPQSSSFFALFNGVIDNVWNSNAIKLRQIYLLAFHL